MSMVVLPAEAVAKAARLAVARLKPQPHEYLTDWDRQEHALKTVLKVSEYSLRQTIGPRVVALEFDMVRTLEPFFPSD